MWRGGIQLEISPACPACPTQGGGSKGWINTVQALCAAKVTGVFSIPVSGTEAEERAHALQEYRHLESRITELTVVTNKEKQIIRRVDMNLELARLRTNRTAARARL